MDSRSKCGKFKQRVGLRQRDQREDDFDFWRGKNYEEPLETSA